MKRDFARREHQVRKQKRPVETVVKLALLALLAILFNGVPRHRTFIPLEPWLPETIEEYEAQCRKEVDDAQRERCREALPAFRHSLMWIDSRLLLREGEELSSRHLDVLHGFPAAGSEAARLAVSSHLASWCRREGMPVPATFNELKRQGCTDRLPTLAEMGLELDPKWAGVRSVKSNYDGKTRKVRLSTRSKAGQP
jgi:hypothetical protein